MQNENDIKNEPGTENFGGPVLLESDLVVPPVKSGWATSEGQLTILFTIAAMVLGWFNIQTTEGQIQNIYDMVVRLFTGLGPILAAGGIIWKYIGSRSTVKTEAIASVGLKSDWWKKILTIGKAVVPIIPGSTGEIAGSILGTNDDSTTVYLAAVVKDHEGRIKSLEKK